MKDKFNNDYFVLRHGQSKPNVLKIVLSDMEEGKKRNILLPPKEKNKSNFL
jgi:hypothetical protein